MWRCSRRSRCAFASSLLQRCHFLCAAFSAGSRQTAATCCGITSNTRESGAKRVQDQAGPGVAVWSAVADIDWAAMQVSWLCAG